jgi:hypothetical protein
MSEYQYYEFIAIDEPLTPKQVAELRSRSSRASITPTRFVNDYQWGNLKGDPVDWMRRYCVTNCCVATCARCSWVWSASRGEVDERSQSPTRCPVFPGDRCPAIAGGILEVDGDATPPDSLTGKIQTRWRARRGTGCLIGALPAAEKPRCSNCC